MNPEQLKALQDSIIKELGIAIDTGVKSQVEALVKEAVEAGKTDMADMKDEIKSLKASLEKKGTFKMSDEEKKGAIVNIFKAVSDGKNVSESQFKEIVASEIKTLDTTSVDGGSNLIFDQFQKDIIKVMDEFEVVSKLKWITLKQGDKIVLPKVTNGITTAYVDQAATGTESKPTFGQVSIDVNKTFSLVNVTEEMFDNMTSVDIYRLIVELIGESQGAFVENEVLNGSAKITGIKNLPNAKVVILSTTSVASLGDDDIVDLQTAIPRKLKRNGNAVFLGNEYVLAQLMKLRTADGARLYPDLRGANPSIDNYPFVVSDVAGDITDSASDGVDKVVLMFGNLKYFQMVRRSELTADRGYINDGFVTGIESIKANQRIGGSATVEEAFAILKTKAS